MKTKLFSFFLALIASVGMLHAQSGTCGANLTWNLTDGVLTISGTGNMSDYNYYRSYAPWYDSREAIAQIVIESGVTSIGAYAFVYCSSLTSITIPNSVTSIGIGAFSNCSSLPIIDNIRYADTYLIEAVDKSLSTYTIKDGTKWIGRSAFYHCSSLTSVTIPYSVTSIGDFAFDGCSSLISITLPNSVTSIGEYAFCKCSSLTSVTIPNSVTSIGNGAFLDCSSLTSITIPESVRSIGESAFSGCDGLISIEIGNKVTSIEKQTFYNCRSLTNVLIGSSVKVLEEKAFASCPALDTITCYSMRPPTVNNAFDNLPYSTIVYVPADYLNTYKTHDFWGLYDVRPLGATSVQITDLQITPDDNTANVVWPTVENAATYEMIIKDKNGVIVCTLIFNANGQLTQIAFNAPSRNNTSEQTQNAGFSFTVTGLDSGTLYDLTMTAKDNSGNILQSTTKSFATNGYTAIEPVESSAMHGGQKILRDGQLYILRDGKTYTVQGQEVR